MSLKATSKMGRNKKSQKSRRDQVRRLTEPAGSYSPTMSRPILPGGWQVNTAMFLLLMIGTLALYVESAASLFEAWLGISAVMSGYLVPLDLFPKAGSMLYRQGVRLDIRDEVTLTV